MNNNEKDYFFNIFLFGETNVGKTRFFSTFNHSEFIDKTTIGIDIASKTYNTNDKVIRARIYDTACIGRLRYIPRDYSKVSHAILICYDITSHKTFEQLDDWIQFVSEVNNKAPFIHYCWLKK